MTQLRADAQENRDRVLAAARVLFSEVGLDVGMRAIAGHAGVGPATLYRRFPTKQLLIDEAFSIEMRTCQQIVDDGCADSDPWNGLLSVVRNLVAHNARNRGFVEAFTSSDRVGGAFAEHRRGLLQKLATLVGQAKTGGSLRSDFVTEDLVLIFTAARGISMTRPDALEAATRRFVDLVILGLHSHAAEPDPR